ncbi:twin-arginine translocase subunit TatB [Acinetobacter sp. ANC 4558]|uniref:Sec-independent protein translocase protein TatB n=1 Tax=Acinetobacter sp. ANC 4558 TaxID=1977876 RepID=UPI000A3329FA|nr:Sec-independent protein translocase protein TatB [Acinetobacter sp. ANC 4558]OTG85311.1 twin-arginine translocase subunit TatB [Acinetobacter sp. ANC 4558]
MLDMGFSEILLFCIVMVVVLGPDKLPQAMRFVGHWYSKTRRLIVSVQRDIERELNLLEMKEQLHKELEQIRTLEEDMQQQLKEMKQLINVSPDHSQENVFQKSEASHQIKSNEMVKNNDIR